MPKHMRELGTLACAKLQQLKTAEVDIVCSGQVDASHLGHFYNSFHLTNYDWNLRSQEPDKAEEEGDEPKDERLKRKSKLIDNFAVHHESGDDFSRA